MWVCLNNAFISAVEDGRHRDTLKVRARKRSHLQRLFPGKRIYESSANDYRFRVFVTKKRFAKLLARKALAIDYGNFKDSVSRENDDLYWLYHDFWDLHRKYQEDHFGRFRSKLTSAVGHDPGSDYFNERKDNESGTHAGAKAPGGWPDLFGGDAGIKLADNRTDGETGRDALRDGDADRS